ncbi:type IV secretory system conjugative DNA transfer family protein [Laspinema olomoucense]|uniref:type IV secretory system conjugative DNA transfer family protein n=1 Tax=Laspinema olomoucense TaxID=3231600 RepID=UPI0021BA5D66|nr:type IV secretory system conjugative DNA transfer family protein [Laspinema sp. D3c]MCT7992544.1 type IV secretory system conjugative DNA transfer family protein [Laspinema sp. D3c]
MMNLKWLAMAPVSLIIGSWMFATSFESTGPVPVLTNAYNNQTQEVSFGVPDTARRILQWGGMAIALGGTAAATFLSLGDKQKISDKQKTSSSSQSHRTQPSTQPQTQPSTRPSTQPFTRPLTRPPVHLPTHSKEDIEFDIWRSGADVSSDVSEIDLTESTDYLTETSHVSKPDYYSFDENNDDVPDEVDVSDEVDEISPIVLSGYAPSKPTKKPSKEPNLLKEAALYGSGLNLNKIKGHLLIPATTQSGKTSTLCGMIREVVQVCPDVIWNGVDPKGSVFLGLERLSHPDGFPVIVSVELDNPYQGIMNTITLLRRAMSEQTNRKRIRQKARQTRQPYNPTPYVVILDEWPTLLKAAKDCDPKAQRTIIQLAESLAFVGLEDNIFLWIIAQSPFVKQLGFDVSVSAQLTTFAIGRAFNPKSIELCRQSINRSLSDKNQRLKLFHQLNTMGEAHPYHPIFFFSSRNQMSYAPDLSNIQEQLIFHPDDSQPINDSLDDSPCKPLNITPEHLEIMQRASSTPVDSPGDLPVDSPINLSIEFNQFVERFRTNEE